MYRPSGYAQRSRSCASHWRRSLSRAQRPPNHGSTAWGRGPGRSRPTMACPRGPEPGIWWSGVDHRLCPGLGCRPGIRPRPSGRSGLGHCPEYRAGASNWSGAALRSVRCRIAFRSRWSSCVARRDLRSCGVRRGLRSLVSIRSARCRAILPCCAGGTSCLAHRCARCRVPLRPGAGEMFCAVLRWQVRADAAGQMTGRVCGRPARRRRRTPACAVGHPRPVSASRRRLCRQASFARPALCAGSGRFSGFRRSAGRVEPTESYCPRLARLRCVRRGACPGRALPECAAGLPSGASIPSSAGLRRRGSDYCVAQLSPALGTERQRIERRRQVPGALAYRHSSFVPAASRVPQPRPLPPASATTLSRQAKRVARPHRERPSSNMSGGVLLSHTVPRAVPSALKSLTSGFGMGPGVSPSL